MVRQVQNQLNLSWERGLERWWLTVFVKAQWKYKFRSKCVVDHWWKWIRRRAASVLRQNKKSQIQVVVEKQWARKDKWVWPSER